MQSEVFQNYSTEVLKKRIRFSNIALCTVWGAGLLGVLASFSKLTTTGTVETVTLVISLVSLLASIPVYKEKQKIIGILKNRNR